MDVNTVQPAAASGLAGFLSEHPISGGIGADLKLLNRAVRKKWPIPREMRLRIIARLDQIIGRESVDIPGPDGMTFDSECQADRNAIGAARELRGMLAEDRDFAMKGVVVAQGAKQHADKMEQGERQLTIDAARVLSQMSEADKKALIHRAGLGHLLDGDQPATA